MARTRKRFWAKTLTLTAALLAVVWVGSMKVWVEQRVWNLAWISLWGGQVSFVASVNEFEAFDRFPITGAKRKSWWPRFTRADCDRFTVHWGVDVGEFRPMGFNGTWARKTWSIPLWPFILLTGVPGVWMMVKSRKHANPYACPACGYDRTGLPQSPTGPAPCPECGKSA